MPTATVNPERFALCLPLTLAYEGGWSNHPDDPGKATMFGVTQAVYDEYRSRAAEPIQSVRLISDAEVRAIYRTRYWDAAGCNALPVGVEYAVFDFAVNSGVARAVKTLQGLLGVTVDGRAGPKTIAAAIAYCQTYGNSALSDALCVERVRFLRTLRNYATFGKGWELRVMGRITGSQEDDTGVVDRALRMIRGEAIASLSLRAATPKTYLVSAS